MYFADPSLGGWNDFLPGNGAFRREERSVFMFIHVKARDRRRQYRACGANNRVRPRIGQVYAQKARTSSAR